MERDEQTNGPRPSPEPTETQEPRRTHVEEESQSAGPREGGESGAKRDRLDENRSGESSLMERVNEALHRMRPRRRD